MGRSKLRNKWMRKQYAKPRCNMKIVNDRKTASMKHLIDSSYLPLDVLCAIRDDRTLLELTHQFPHWFQRRVLEVKQVFNVNIAGFSNNREYNSGIYTSAVLDNLHKIVICFHKYHYRFSDIQQAIRAYKSLKVIVEGLKENSCLSIVNGGDFCADLPDEFYSCCPKWNEYEIESCLLSIDRQLNTDSKDYNIKRNSDNCEVVCNKHYVPGGWNFTIYPGDITDAALLPIKNVRNRIDNLINVLEKHSTGKGSDVAIGVLPLEENLLVL